MRLKVVSDGKRAYVCDAETGSVVEGVQVVTWTWSEDQGSDALIHLIGVQCEITGEVGTMLLDDPLNDSGFPYVPPELDVGGDVTDISELLKRKDV